MPSSNDVVLLIEPTPRLAKGTDYWRHRRRSAESVVFNESGTER
jgi:hypothetical protein